MKRIAYSKASAKALARGPVHMSQRIRSGVEAYAANPASQASNVKVLASYEEFRLCVGAWRVIMNDRGEVLQVIKIARTEPRKEATMEDTITIPRSEYERLVALAEDASDARAIEEFKVRLARGEEELLPPGFADRMLAGENIITLWREHRRLGKSELAELAGVHRVNLAKIESGGHGASVETLKRLANVLNVTIDDLV